MYGKQELCDNNINKGDARMLNCHLSQESTNLHRKIYLKIPIIQSREKNMKFTQL